MKKTMLITADIHFERIPVDKRTPFIDYLKRSIIESLPDFFIIAGDTADSRNLRAESDDFHELCNFIEEIKDLCKKQGTTFIVLKGTPSHHGDIMQTVCSFMKNDILYIDTMCTQTIKGLNIGFIPELYYSRYDDFLSDLKEKISFTQDVIIFHGMMGFAIPAVKQIDSQWNLHRNLVMKHKDVEDYAKCLVIGGHVHNFMSTSKTHYTGRAINNPGEVTFNRVFGVQLVEVDTTSREYTLKTITNNMVKDVKKVEINMVTDDVHRFIEEFKDKDMEGFRFVISINSNNETMNKYNEFIDVVKPLYTQIKHISEEKKVSTIKIDTKDIDELVYEFYKSKTNETISETLAKEIQLK